MTIVIVIMWICFVIVAIITIKDILLHLLKIKKRSRSFWIKELATLLLTFLSLYVTSNFSIYIPKFFLREYHDGPYNEGYYYGWWKNEKPQGNGVLKYDFFDDEKYYEITVDGQKYKALYYKGEFDKGYRVGKGTVYYEGGYRDEGTFYGAWEEGKKIFEGKRWLTNDTYNGYIELKMYGKSNKVADEKTQGEWVVVG